MSTHQIMPVKINTYYVPIYIRGMVVFVNKVSKRNKDQFVMNVDWFRKDDTTGKFISMDINQDVVIDRNTFNKEWKQIDL